MQLLHTRKLRIGSKFKFFGGDVYLIRKLTPADFLDEDDGLPLNFFKQVDNGKSMYEQTMQASCIDIKDKKDGDSQLMVLNFMLSKCVVYENKIPFDVAKFMAMPGTTKNMNKMLALFSSTIKMSFKRFQSCTSIDDSNAIAIFVLANRFCKTPIDILLPHGDYSEMDAWMFNMYIASVGIKEENRQAKKAMSKK